MLRFSWKDHEIRLCPSWLLLSPHLFSNAASEWFKFWWLLRPNSPDNAFIMAFLLSSVLRTAHWCTETLFGVVKVEIQRILL